MRFGRYEFSPGLWPTLVTLAVLPVLVGLGNWQLNRADWKQSLIDAHDEAVQLAPLPLLEVLDGGGDTAYRPVHVAGRYDLSHQLLLDNRIHHGMAGYHVLTPLLTVSGHAVLVNRGWLPLGASRSDLPGTPGPVEPVFLTGTLARLPGKIIRLDSTEEPNRGWPQVIQHIAFDDIERRLGYALLPVVIQLDASDEHGFTREWKAVYSITPAKHRAYAMQWYTLAAVLLLIYIGVNTRRIEREAKGNQ